MPKCPKCQYFSFDSGERCRNCGYDFSLALDLPIDNTDSDLRIQNGNEPLGPLGDFTLNITPNETPNLPLFKPGADPDAPLVAPGAPPRPPLAVRRGAPTTGRPVRPKRDRPDVDPEPRLALDTAEIPVVVPRPAAPVAAATEPEPTVTTAGNLSRLVAAVVDAGLLGGINVIIIYFTLRICDLTFADIVLLPAAPLLAFLLLLDGGYLAIFIAAGGQTIGKMASGIRVVPADPAAPPSERVGFGRAVLRAVALVLSAAPAGLGLLPALFGPEHRGLHDRLADTRVVKA